MTKQSKTKQLKNSHVRTLDDASKIRNISKKNLLQKNKRSVYNFVDFCVTMTCKNYKYSKHDVLLAKFFLLAKICNQNAFCVQFFCLQFPTYKFRKQIISTKTHFACKISKITSKTSILQANRVSDFLVQFSVSVFTNHKKYD